MNLYFEDYANGAEFFDIDDFVQYTGMAYADLLGQEYIGMYNQMRQDGDNSVIEFSHDWLKTEVVKREKDNEGYFVNLLEPIMSFPYDKRDVGLQNIFPVGTQFKGELIRSSISESWLDEYIPLSCKVYWSLLGKKIYLSTTMGEPPASLRVVYVPSLSDSLEIPASRQKMVIDNTIKMMREAARGFLVKETNNQNLNELPITDNARNLIKQ